jgi:hypothetical protein
MGSDTICESKLQVRWTSIFAPYTEEHQAKDLTGYVIRSTILENDRIALQFDLSNF